MKIIHLLNWKLETIEKELENIKKQGFDAIQINSMQPFKEESEFKWWSSYQPLGFRIGNMFGSKDNLKRLCSKGRELGLDIVVDVVLNHTANMDGNNPLVPHSSVDSELLFANEFWKERIMLKNGDDREDAVKHLIGLPGLDLSNLELQKIIFRYLKELKECGVKGLRFDAAKHIGLPNDGVDFFKKVRKFMLINGMYGYGEFLGGTKEWRDEMAELLFVLSPEGTTLTDINKLVTFFESHDTFLNFNDQNYNQTRSLSSIDLANNYRRIRQKYNNTIAYVRPIDLKGAYVLNGNGLSYDQVYKLDEREYFDRSYFESSEIRDINKEKNNDKINILIYDSRVKR